MPDLPVSLRHARALAAICGAAVAVAFGAGAGCGVETHTQKIAGQSGSGGQAPGSGGATTGSGGSNSGSGGSNSGSGGSNSGSGGQPIGSGGQTAGSGGRATGSGGATTGSGGATTGSGGATSGSGGATSGSGGATSGSGGSSGAGVMINGTFVPKEKAIVFIHFGHSNMRGQATMPTSLRPFFYNTQNGLWSYQGGTTFTLAMEPTAPEGTMTFAGPGMAILHAAASAVSTSSGYQFISIGRGVGSDTTEDYLKTIGGAPGALYASFITNRAVTLKGNVTFGAIVIMLGITERHLPTADQPGYPGRIQQIVSDIRADLGEPNLPVMYCDYEEHATGDLAPTGAVGVVILPLTRMLPGLVPNLVLVPTGKGLGPNGPNDDIEMQDDHHFDMAGHQVWGWRVINLMQTNGWFPWK